MASRVQRVAEMRANLDAAKEQASSDGAPALARWPDHIEQKK